jgi:hypothetical protein
MTLGSSVHHDSVAGRRACPHIKVLAGRGAGPLGVEPRCILRPRAFDIARCPVMHGRRALSRFRPTGRDAGRYRSEEGLTLTHIGASPPGVITWRNTGGHRPPYPFLHSPLIYQKVGCLAPKYLCITILWLAGEPGPYKSSCRRGPGPLGVEPTCILRPRAFDIARCPVMHGRRARSTFFQEAGSPAFLLPLPFPAGSGWPSQRLCSGCSMLTRLPSLSMNETYRPTPGISIGSPSTSPPASVTFFEASLISSTAITTAGY